MKQGDRLIWERKQKDAAAVPTLYRGNAATGADSVSGASGSGRTAYEQEREDLITGYRGAAERRRETYERESGEARQDTSASLRAAYVAAKNSGRRLPQVMSASGLTGGVSDMAARSAAAGYESLRSELAAERDRQLSALLEQYTQGSEKDRESYQLRLNALNRRYKRALESLQ